MATTTLTLSYRPVRIGFLVREGHIEDIVEAAGINTLLWGGIYNPIIPVSNDIEIFKKFTNHFNYDFIEAFNKLEINIVKNPWCTNEEIKNFKEDIHEIIRGMEINFNFVETIPATKAGKRHFIINEDTGLLKKYQEGKLKNNTLTY